MKKFTLLFLIIFAPLFINAQQQLPNSSFENWAIQNNAFPYEEPDNWFGTSVICNWSPTADVCDPSTIKTSDAYSGSYAAKLVNLADTEDEDIWASQLIYSFGSDGYVNFTDKPTALTGYYKFNKIGADNINISITILGPTSYDIIAYGTRNLNASKTNYTLFTVPLQYFSQSLTPKDIYVHINFNDDASENSDFTVDNLVLTYTSTPTSTATPVSAGIKFFPNPGKDMIYFEKQVKNISIQSTNGSLILTYAGEMNELNISSLDKGIYIITYEHNELLIHDKLIVE